jgi:hypothetical protein
MIFELGDVNSAAKKKTAIRSNPPGVAADG